MRPHVIVNMAMTADGKVDTAERRGARISNADDIGRVDRLRADVDGVMVGGHTLLAEDPRLTVRAPELVAARERRGRPRQPARIGVVSALPDPDTGADLPSGSRFLEGEPARVVVITTERTSAEVRGRLEACGAEVLVAGSERVDLACALDSLAASGIERLLVEGGGTLVEALFAQDLVDELRLFIAPIVLGGADAPTPAEGLGFSIDDAVRLHLAETTRLGSDGIMVRYLVQPRGVRIAGARTDP